MIASIMLSLLALLIGSVYVSEQFVLGWVALIIGLDALLASISHGIRGCRLQLWIRWISSATSLLWLGVWITSLCACIRVPCAGSTAWAVFDGNVVYAGGSELPLTFEATWNWRGFTTGDLTMSRFTHGWSFARHWPSLPLLVAFVAPTAVLWWLRPRVYPPGSCKSCGYNLTGNVSGRCPECGTLTADAKKRRAE